MLDARMMPGLWAMDRLSRHEHFSDYRRACDAIYQHTHTRIRDYDCTKVATTLLAHRLRTSPLWEVFEDFEVCEQIQINQYTADKQHNLTLTMLVKKSLYRSSHRDISFQFFIDQLHDVHNIRVLMATRGHYLFPWESKFKVDLPDSLGLEAVLVHGGVWTPPKLPERQARQLALQGFKRIRIGETRKGWVLHTNSEDEYLFARMLF